MEVVLNIKHTEIQRTESKDPLQSVMSKRSALSKLSA